MWYNTLSMSDLYVSPGVHPTADDTADPSADDRLLISPLSYSSHHPSLPLTPIICDKRAIAGLLESFLDQAGLSKKEAAARLGVDVEAVRQYLNGRRVKPSLLWFIRFVNLCGGRVMVEWPAKAR